MDGHPLHVDSLPSVGKRSQQLPNGHSSRIRPQLVQLPGRLDGNRLSGEPNCWHGIARGQKSVLLLSEQLQPQLMAFCFAHRVLSFESCLLTSLLRLNPRRHRPFRILPRHKGGWNDPRAVSPRIELELRGKNERLSRRDTKRLIYKLKVLGQPVTSEVRSSAEK